MTNFGEIISRFASRGRTQPFGVRAYVSLDSCYVIELTAPSREDDDTERRDKVEEYMSTTLEASEFPIVVLLRYKD